MSVSVQEASAPLRNAEQKADVALVFVSGAHAALDKLGRITAHLRDHLPSLQCIFGASVCTSIPMCWKMAGGGKGSVVSPL